MCGNGAALWYLSRAVSAISLIFSRGRKKSRPNPLTASVLISYSPESDLLGVVATSLRSAGSGAQSSEHFIWRRFCSRHLHSIALVSFSRDSTAVPPDRPSHDPSCSAEFIALASRPSERAFGANSIPEQFIASLADLGAMPERLDSSYGRTLSGSALSLLSTSCERTHLLR